MIMTSAVDASIQAVSPLSIRYVPPRRWGPAARPDLRRLGSDRATVVPAAGTTRCRLGALRTARSERGCGWGSNGGYDAGHDRTRTGAPARPIARHLDL